jgi:hypothetical protein
MNEAPKNGVIVSKISTKDRWEFGAVLLDPRIGLRGGKVRELQSSKWIVVKGLMLLLISAATATLIVLENPSLRAAALIILLVWSTCRFYYFLFYVLEKYVDPNFRYAGLIALMAALRRRRRGGTNA